MTAHALHIGVNAHWPKQAGPYVNDAIAFENFSRARGYIHHGCLLGADATRDAVQQAILKAVKAVKRGDHLLLTFSCHGTRTDGQVRESLLLHGGRLSDHLLYEALGELPEQSEAIVVVDACHAEGMVTPFALMGDSGDTWVQVETTITLYDPRPPAKGLPPLAACVHELAATRKAALAYANGVYEGERLGTFTAALLAELVLPTTATCYDELIEHTAERMQGQGQTPIHHKYGGPCHSKPLFLTHVR